jgi:glycosidase
LPASVALVSALLLLASCGADERRRVEGATTAPLAPVVSSHDSGSEWWRSAIFYEVFVRSFADSTSGRLAGDGVGDLAGLVERLDYLNDGDPTTDEDLEVDALWLMPIMQSPSYHGYDVTDYRRVDKEYGTNEDFKRLIAEAHDRGIRVIVDLVLNHTSSHHPWFRDAWRRRSPYHDWYIWSYETRDYLGPWSQPVWHELRWWQRGWKHFNYMGYYGVFWSGMPDLDYRNPEVTSAMYDVSRFWLEEMAADGFRLDAIRHLIEDGPVQQDTPGTHDWLEEFQRFVHEVEQSALTVGEVWADTEVVAEYGPDELDLTFQFDLATAIVDAALSGSPGRLVTALEEIEAAFPSGRYATFLTNHDQPRTFSVLDEDVAQAKLAASLLLTLPGVPFIYYGEEIGMSGLKPDPLIRRPMQWSPDRYAGFSSHRPWQDPHPRFRAMTVAGQTEEEDSLLSHYRRLIRLRKRHPALLEGSLDLVATNEDAVFAFRRTSSGDLVLVVANLDDEPVTDYSLDIGVQSLPIDAAPIDLLRGVGGLPFAGDAEPYRPLAELAPETAYLLAWPAEADERDAP